MPKYVIERNMPGAGLMSRADLAAIADKSCRALEELGPQIQWVESFVTRDKIYSIYIARDQRLIREHAYLSGFPADKICEVQSVIDPSMGNEARRAQEHDTAKESGMS
jgi:hypothetical protein